MSFDNKQYVPIIIIDENITLETICDYFKGKNFKDIRFHIELTMYDREKEYFFKLNPMSTEIILSKQIKDKVKL